MNRSACLQKHNNKYTFKKMAPQMKSSAVPPTMRPKHRTAPMKSPRATHSMYRSPLYDSSTVVSPYCSPLRIADLEIPSQQAYDIVQSKINNKKTIISNLKNNF